MRRRTSFDGFYLITHDHMVNLHLSYIAKIDFLGSATKCAFGQWIEQEFSVLIEFDRDHVYIKYLQTV